MTTKYDIHFRLSCGLAVRFREPSAIITHHGEVTTNLPEVTIDLQEVITSRQEVIIGHHREAITSLQAVFGEEVITSHQEVTTNHPEVISQ